MRTSVENDGVDEEDGGQHASEEWIARKGVFDGVDEEHSGQPTGRE